MRSRFIQTMQLAGQWAHGMIIPESQQPAMQNTETRNSFIQKIRSLTREMEQALTTFTRSFTMQLLADLPRMTILQLTGKALRAYPQMQGAGDNADDIGYFAFPITVDGKQYSPADEDYCFGINANSDETNQKAAMIFVKWMTEKSGYSYNEGGLPIAVGDDKLPEVYQEFTDNNVEFISNEPAIEGEEDVLNELNADSELMVGAGGNEKIQAIVEHASNGDEDFDDIMKEWNEKWSDAQDTDDVEVNK